ncbi:MAG: hypothetical protein CVU39_17090 [Chloroflexi bacterium HGW-Chloroflexi-10]|nr:MAG: hypothetical protein CVU39_17090 [Chloroflexi bacterium HGW-Chloroflexi-10]
MIEKAHNCVFFISPFIWIMLASMSGSIFYKKFISSLGIFYIRFPIIEMTNNTHTNDTLLQLLYMDKKPGLFQLICHPDVGN